ncbi:MAG: Wzt carbohydrate-binding domain-containing protein [Candidatus Omnitrophica bacterium]|nr:Wzt carbohydrate-binding domain-containing protein [Candidatus Omnitrophota bacterium]
MDIVIELKQISKKYPNPGVFDEQMRSDLGDFLALCDISLGISRGDVIGIIGRNGAGKTTLLNILAGVLSPTQGQVFTKGRVLGLFNLGVGFQDELTGRHNIFLNGTLLGATRKEIEEKLDTIIGFSELGDFIDMPLGSYSQGMRLRLGFSIITSLDFDVLLLDEILAVGDLLFQSKCFERMMDFRRQGKTLVITTQDMGLIERLCDKVVLLDHGRVLFCGHAEECISKYRALLSAEKFFVGVAHKKIILFENTKKWGDVAEWGKKLGTKEVVIESVEFINRFGFKCGRIKSGGSLRIRSKFNSRNSVKEAHFGAAIFRGDGVYCYGPNTAFDGHLIKEIRVGRGWFELRCNELLLAPGEYKVSVAIWDKNESLAFDYHSGYYNLKVDGKVNGVKELLSIPASIKNNILKKDMMMAFNPDILNKDKTQDISNERVKSFLVGLVDKDAKSREAFITNDPASLRINFQGQLTNRPNYCLWAGFFRSDNVFCHGFILLFNEIGYSELTFAELPRLPGGYRVAAGLWDKEEKRFIYFCHNACVFRTVSEKGDHGTIYLKHKWDWRLP